MTIPEFYQQLLYGCCCLLYVSHFSTKYSWHVQYSLCYGSAAVLVYPY